MPTKSVSTELRQIICHLKKCAFVFKCLNFSHATLIANFTALVWEHLLMA